MKNIINNTLPVVTTFKTNDNGDVYYIDPNNNKSSTDIDSNGKAYMAGTCIINGIPYVFDDNGILKTGWQRETVLYHYYYYSDKGNMARGLIKYNDNYYYSTLKKGQLTNMTIGTIVISGVTYDLKANEYGQLYYNNGTKDINYDGTQTITYKDYLLY